MQLRDAPGMDTRTEPVMILEASGHGITAAARAAPGMGAVRAAEISGLGRSLTGIRLWKHRGAGVTGAQFNNWNKQLLA